MAFYLGIDGGGSKTTCAVGDETSLFARATAGPSNITRVSEVRARESLHQSIRDACTAAAMSASQVRSACIGAAGAGRPEVASAIRKIVAELISGDIEVVGDMPIALEAAFGERPGVIVVAGTGSIAYGRDRQGKTARAGGWGYAVSDEGSAYWIGRRAIERFLRSIDENLDAEKNTQALAQASSLFQEMKTLLNISSLDEFVRAANATPEFATLLPAVIAASTRGDPVAQAVLARAGEELARIAALVIRRLFSKDDRISIGLAGGVFRHSARVREIFSEKIRACDPRVEVNQKIVEPVEGALQMARRMNSLK